MQSNEDLQKKRQILYSWSWFYTNSSENLMVSRYPTYDRTVYDESTKGEKVVRKHVLVSDMWNQHYGNTSNYSKRIKEDRDKASACSLEIIENQKNINKFYKKKD